MAGGGQRLSRRGGATFAYGAPQRRPGLAGRSPPEGTGATAVSPAPNADTHRKGGGWFFYVKNGLSTPCLYKTPGEGAASQAPHPPVQPRHPSPCRPHAPLSPPPLQPDVYALLLKLFHGPPTFLLSWVWEDEGREGGGRAGGPCVPPPFLRRFLLSLLSDQRLVDVGDDACGEKRTMFPSQSFEEASLGAFPTLLWCSPPSSLPRRKFPV